MRLCARSSGDRLLDTSWLYQSRLLARMLVGATGGSKSWLLRRPTYLTTAQVCSYPADDQGGHFENFHIDESSDRSGYKDSAQLRALPLRAGVLRWWRVPGAVRLALVRGLVGYPFLCKICGAPRRARRPRGGANFNLQGSRPRCLAAVRGLHRHSGASVVIRVPQFQQTCQPTASTRSADRPS